MARVQKKAFNESKESEHPESKESDNDKKSEDKTDKKPAFDSVNNPENM